jgi:hypothetical protein
MFTVRCSSPLQSTSIATFSLQFDFTSHNDGPLLTYVQTEQLSPANEDGRSLQATLNLNLMPIMQDSAAYNVVILESEGRLFACRGPAAATNFLSACTRGSPVAVSTETKFDPPPPSLSAYRYIDCAVLSRLADAVALCVCIG